MLLILFQYDCLLFVHENMSIWVVVWPFSPAVPFTRKGDIKPGIYTQ